MGKRKLQFIVVICLLGMFLLWIAVGYDSQSEEANCREWKHNLERAAKVQVLRHRLPEPLVRLFRLPALESRFFDRSESLKNTLLSSGYLTNLCLALTNSSVSRYQIFSSLQQAAKGTSAEQYWDAGITSNTLIVVTCRTKDSSLFMDALKE
jgi:hypothetical protein